MELRREQKLSVILLQIEKLDLNQMEEKEAFTIYIQHLYENKTVIICANSEILKYPNLYHEQHYTRVRFRIFKMRFDMYNA